MTTTAASMKRLTEAADPLYRSLNDDQKRRLVMLARPAGGPHMGMRPHWRDRTDFDDRREERRFGRDRDRGELQMHRPERL